MKNIKMIYKVIFIVIIGTVLLLYNFEVYATDDIIKGAENFLDAGTDIVLNSESIKNTSDIIFNVFSVIGTIVVVLVGAILGIQFIMGSIEEKAKIKELLIPYVIGSIVIFGAVGIWTVAIKVFSNIF